MVIAFWREESVSVKDLTTSLVKFVHTHQNEKGTNFDEDLPQGYCSIGIFEPIGIPEGNGRSVRAFDVASGTKDMIETCIAQKMQRAPAYRVATPEVWLLIVNDHFLGPGEVRTDPDRLAEWRFNSDFDKVLLSLRQADGGGRVIELQRAS